MRHPFRNFLDRQRKRSELARIRKAAKNLDVGRLVGIEEDPFRMTLDADPNDVDPRLFGYYTAEGVDYALTELGIYGRIQEKGYGRLHSIVSGDGWRQDLKVFGELDGEDLLVVEGRFKRKPWDPPEGTPICGKPMERPYNMIDIEWFLLQDPKADFSPDRPRLPGQKHPGLGLRDEIMEVFYAVARRLRLDGYLANAKLFHNAVMYSPMFFFVRPERQAELNAITEAGKGHSLQDLSLAIEGGYLYHNGTDGPYQWLGEEMIRPLSEEILTAFHECEFRREVEERVADKFRFDWDGYYANRENLAEKLLEEHPMAINRGQS